MPRPCRRHGRQLRPSSSAAGIVARDTERRRKRLYRLDGLSETHLERRQQLSRRPIPLVSCARIVRGNRHRLARIAREHRPPSLRSTAQERSPARRPAHSGHSRRPHEVVLAICRQCPQVVHVRVLRGNLPQCIKGYDRFLQLVRGDLCPRGVATGNRIPRLDGDYASVGPLGRVIIVFGKGEIALNCMTLGSFGASVSASASRRWAEGRSPVAMNTRAEAISPLRTDSLPFVSKSYWPENADDAIMDAP